MPDKPEEKKQQSAPQGNRDLGQQILGGLIGALVVAIALQIGPWNPANRTSPMLAGAAIGAILFTLDRFALAGARITRREDARVLNIVVGVSGMLVLTAVVWGVVLLVAWIWQQMRG